MKKIMGYGFFKSIKIKDLKINFHKDRENPKKYVKIHKKRTNSPFQFKHKTTFR